MPGEAVEARLVALIHERTAIGVRKYGEPLHTHNGRDAKTDALEESLDLNQYLMQSLMEAEDANRALAAERDAAVKRAEAAEAVVGRLRQVCGERIGMAAKNSDQSAVSILIGVVNIIDEAARANAGEGGGA